MRPFKGQEQGHSLFTVAMPTEEQIDLLVESEGIGIEINLDY